MTFEKRSQHARKTNKGLKIAKILIIAFAAIFFFIAISNFFSNLEYLNSEKVETTAVIQEIDGVKTYSFPAVNYGVGGQDPEIKDIGDVGDEVTIYYQKDKPHVVYRSEKPKWIWLDVIGPLLSGTLLIGFAYFCGKLPRLFPKWLDREIENQKVGDGKVKYPLLTKREVFLKDLKIILLLFFATLIFKGAITYFFHVPFKWWITFGLYFGFTAVYYFSIRKELREEK